VVRSRRRAASSATLGRELPPATWNLRKQANRRRPHWYLQGPVSLWRGPKFNRGSRVDRSAGRGGARPYFARPSSAPLNSGALHPVFVWRPSASRRAANRPAWAGPRIPALIVTVGGSLPVNRVSGSGGRPVSAGPFKPCPEDESGHAHFIGKTRLGWRELPRVRNWGKPAGDEGVPGWNEARRGARYPIAPLEKPEEGPLAVRPGI
jgi:hypothetical protein